MQENELEIKLWDYAESCFLRNNFQNTQRFVRQK